jgi:hypothetical protein
MGRVSRVATLTAVVAMAAGLVALLLEFSFIVPAFVIGTAAILIALFAGFRRSHLIEIDRTRQR